MNKSILLVIVALICAIGLKGQEAVNKSYDLDEVVVTATRMNLPLKNIPQKVEIIDKKKIESIPAENAAELLKRTVNLDIIQYPGTLSGVGMRGFSPSTNNRNYTLLLIDGKPTGTTNLTSIPSDFIERIEVVKGPYSVLYGSDAMGGVINIITKSVSDKGHAAMSMSAGSFGQFNFSQYANVPVTKKFGFALGMSRKVQSEDYKIGSKNMLNISETEKLILDKKSYGDKMGHTQFAINQLVAKLNYKFNDTWNADLTQMVVISNDIQTPGNYWHSYGLSMKDFTRLNTMLDIRRESYGNTLIISPYLSNYFENNYNNNSAERFVNSKEHVRQMGIRLSDTQTWGSFQLVGGADADMHEVFSERFSDQFTPINPYRPNHTRLSASAFAQGVYSLNNFFVNAGVRYNYTRFTLEADNFLKNEKKSTGYSNINPSVGIKYVISPALNIHASAGNAFFVPDAYKTAGRYQVGKQQYRGKEDLKAETSTSFDVGVNLMQNKWLNLDVTYFQAFYRNKIVNDNSNPEYTTYKNADDARMSGLEMMLSADIARAFGSRYSLELYGSFTQMLKNEFDEKSSDTNKPGTLTKEMLYARKNNGNFGIAFSNNNGFNVRLNARYIGKRLENDWMVGYKLRPNITAEHYYSKGGYVAADQILQHSAHLVFDASAYYTFCKRARVGISLSNLFDENYTEKDGYNMPGRSIMGSFTYTFL